jgi:hypothetical protein
MSFRNSSSNASEPQPLACCRLVFFTAAFNRFTAFTCLLFTDRNSEYWRGVWPTMVEEFPPFDGRVSPARWKKFPSYGGRIYRPIVEGNRGSWKDFPGQCGRNSPLWWKDFPPPECICLGSLPANGAWKRLFVSICQSFYCAQRLNARLPREWWKDFPRLTHGRRPMVEGFPLVRRFCVGRYIVLGKFAV